MIQEEYTAKATLSVPDSGAVAWESPSNIALVKYWGKKPVQLPANASISFTLKNCYTSTKLSFSKANQRSVQVFVGGQEQPSFLKKIETFFERIQSYCPYVNNYAFKIETENTFPHSSGIASSASGFSALALCVLSIERKAAGLSDADFYEKASFLSRLGSGSACRSVYGPMGVWGTHSNYEGSSNDFAIPYDDVHQVFKGYQDTILLVDKGEKKVSSTLGHDLMNEHPFAANRFEQAKTHMIELQKILKSGNILDFNRLVEKEALTLHAMMMTSDPYFMLFKPNTLRIIHKVWEKRESDSIPFTITLDAGANVHLLYPAEYKQLALDFIKEELIVYCQNEQYICDEVGNGPLLKMEHYA
jgi:diphosphomevalonate decarboxylase